MPAQPILSILHISDFHFTHRRFHDQELVVAALIEDLQTLCIGHRRPDVVMFTGDLVHAGGVDSHDEAYDVLLAKVARATGCSDERIFIVPGNHDVSQSIVSDTRTEHHEWRQSANNMAAMNKLYLDRAFDDVASQKFRSYYDLERYLSEGLLKYRDAFVSVYQIEQINIDIVVFNTAILSAGGHKEVGDDLGKLVVPEYAIFEATKALEKESFRIIATHHPFETLSEAGGRTLRNAIQQHGNVHLFGHKHDPMTTDSTNFKGRLYSDQAGAVFTARKNAYIGYSLISVDRDTNLYETYLRTYFDDRRCFDAALDVVAEGRFYSSQGARSFWRKIAHPIDDVAFREYLSGKFLSAVQRELDQSSGDGELHEKFVPPPMKRLVVQAESNDDGKNAVEVDVTFQDLSNGYDNSIVYASPEYGRTTVLKELSVCPESC